MRERHGSVITYKIVSRNISPSEKSRVKRRRLDPADPDYKELLFERAFQHNPFRKDNRVRIVNTTRTATLVDVYDQLKDVIWVDNKPHFLEIEFDDTKERQVATPYQLTRKNVK